MPDDAQCTSLKSASSEAREDRPDNLRLDIVVPVRNERARLSTLLVLLAEALPLHGAVDWRVLVIDDGSQDDTWNWLMASAREPSSRVSGIKLTRNFGKEAAILAGLLESEAPLVLVMDGDLEHPPSLIPEMIELWCTLGTPIVSAVSRRKPTEALVRRAGAAAFYRFFYWWTRIDLENSSDFKLLTRTVVDAYVALTERQKFFRGMTAWLGFAEAKVEFEAVTTKGKQSAWTLPRLVAYGWRSMLAFSAAPLSIIGVLGAGTLVFSLVLGIQTISRWAMGHSVEGFTTVIIVQLLLGSSLMLGLGVLGSYLALIYEEVKQRPPFLVERKTAAATGADSATPGELGRLD